MRTIVDFFINLDAEKAVDIVISIGIIAVFYILSPLFSYVIIKIFNIKKSDRKIKENAFYLPLRSFFRVLGIYIALRYLKPIIGFNDNIMDWITNAFRIIVILTTAIGLVHSITENSTFIKKMQEKSDNEIDETNVMFIVRIIRVLIYIVAAYLILRDLGYDLSGVITGLGLGSIVVTIAAQDTIKNLFGGLVIFLDRPFKVGDYIKFGDYEGTVEDLTFRSTKLRTSENSIAQIPNSEISSTTVVNLSKMKKRRYELNLSLVSNTNLDQIIKLEEQVLNFLNSNEHVIENSAHMLFKGITSSNYSISIYCYIDIVEYDEFMKEKEKINYTIMDLINQSSIELSDEPKTITVKTA